MARLIQGRVKFGPFQADLATRELWRNDIRLKLGGQPFQILIALLEKPGQLVSREELCKRVWSDDTYVDFSHGLNAAVNKLREALCDSPEDPRYIETLPRRGYRFIAKVEELEAELATDAKPEFTPRVETRPPTQVADPSVVEGLQSSVPVNRQRLVQLLAVVAPIVLILVGLTGSFWSHGISRQPSPEEIEAFQKKGAELAYEDMERRAKEQQEARELAVFAVESAARSPRKQPAVVIKEQSSSNVTANPHPATTLRPSPSEESFLLRMARPAGTRVLMPEEPGEEKPSILRVDMPHRNGSYSISRILRGWDAIGGPQPSPDGKKLVFSAGRPNSGEIWVCNIDGTSPKMLTHLNDAGTPRWSPDSHWIAFDSDGRLARSGIYVVSAEGGPVRTIVQNDTNNSVPSWSRDGKYIYFASNRGNNWEGDQVWKIPFAGGDAIQVTHHGGFSAFESPDGQMLYYAKTRYQNPEIWQISVNGGTETRVALVHPSTWASWAVTNSGILLLSEYNSSASQLEYFDFATRSIHSLATLEKASFWLGASFDGSSIWYSELTDYQARQFFTASMD